MSYFKNQVSGIFVLFTLFYLGLATSDAAVLDGFELAHRISDSEMATPKRVAAVIDLYSVDPRAASKLFHQSNLKYALRHQPFPNGFTESTHEILRQLLNPLDSLQREIEEEVMDFNAEAEAAGIQGRYPVLRWAGSSQNNLFLYSTEARVHYLSLLDDLSPEGYIHPTIIPSGMVKDLAPLILEKFNEPSLKVFTVIIGDGKAHFASLALDRSGRIVIIDSSFWASFGFQILGKQDREALAQTLNLNAERVGTPIQFQTPEYLSGFQQRENYNCLIFSILNTHQIAKRGSLEAYREVSQALEWGLLHNYEDLFQIGEESSFTQEVHRIWSPSNWRSYGSFMKSFREKTQELLEEYLKSGEF
jgi:hypothetical protein